jgi:dienelactone hydrolase
MSAEQVRADGIVTFPPDFDLARTWPLVLIIHGGPTGSSNEGFDPLAQLMAARGWIVLQPNYRGSDNRGNAFPLGIVPGAGSGPGRDVIAGVETLQARGYVGAARIAVSGWSYGGFMTVWMIGHYPGWRVAVAGAAAMDLTDMYALSDLNVMHRHAITGSPWTDGREAFFQSESPLTSAATIKTPTLLLSNTGDARVAVTQTYKLFRALEDNGIETRFVAYPTAGMIEDVDLIARDRGTMYGPGDLNEMDGLREDAAVLFILTTNRPANLERALASRPGRIDQAIEFPLPDDNGRRLLVRLYACGLPLDEDVVEVIVRKTDKASAAFIKELMRRVAQFHIQNGSDGVLKLDDINAALEEMTFTGGSLNAKLLGAEGIALTSVQ